MIARHANTISVLVMATLGLVGVCLSQTVAPKAPKPDRFELRDADGKLLGVLTLDRSTEMNQHQVVSLDYSGPPDVIADQELEWTKWSRHPQLEVITIRQTVINKRLIEYIATLDSVRVLWCEECSVEEDAFQSLGDMKGLQSFYFMWITGPSPISDWTFLNGMPHLQTLEVMGQVNADFANSFPHLEDLREISFAVDEKAAREVFPRLVELKSIKKLTIGRVKSQ
jgi:hypothetical protein